MDQSIIDTSSSLGRDSWTKKLKTIENDWHSENVSLLLACPFSRLLCTLQAIVNKSFHINLKLTQQRQVGNYFWVLCLPSFFLRDFWIAAQFPRCLLTLSDWEAAHHSERSGEVHPQVPHGSCTVLDMWGLSWLSRALLEQPSKDGRERKSENLLLAGLIFTSGCAVPCCCL